MGMDSIETWYRGFRELMVINSFDGLLIEIERQRNVLLPFYKYMEITQGGVDLTLI